MKRALIAMSGGVDSAVAAGLMMEAGWDCIGVNMKLHPSDTASFGEKCGSPKDASDAAACASRLGIPFESIDCSCRFEQTVVRDFVQKYEMGQTPNPCIECNRHLKFGALYDRARELGCDTVVTGHYARIERRGDRYCLLKATDPKKDQSYVLYFLTQEQLAHTVFPLGNMKSKEAVRAWAQSHGFENAHRPDSQDICFVPDGDYAAFLSRYTGKSYPVGKFVDPDGKTLGEHKGLIAYTVGQRRGLGLALPEAGYVIEKRPQTNEIVVAPHRYLLTDTVRVGTVNWIAFDAPPATFRAEVALRYQAPPVPATVAATADGALTLTLDTPQRKPAAGQSAVLYDGDLVLGGGIIL